MSRIFATLCLAIMVMVRIFPTSAYAYDSSWYKADFWAGEWPHGFTLRQDVITKIRKEPVPEVSRTIDCALKRGATYHPWNTTRVASSRLEFISYIPIATFVITKPLTITFTNEQTQADVVLSFVKGDEWTYLTYYAEGTFRISYKDVTYDADQSLMEVSKEKEGAVANKKRAVDEWLKLSCDNGAIGWLLLGDVQNQPVFGGPELPGYGKAVDRPNGG